MLASLLWTKSHTFQYLLSFLSWCRCRTNTPTLNSIIHISTFFWTPNLASNAVLFCSTSIWYMYILSFGLLFRLAPLVTPGSVNFTLLRTLRHLVHCLVLIFFSRTPPYVTHTTHSLSLCFLFCVISIVIMTSLHRKHYSYSVAKYTVVLRFCCRICRPTTNQSTHTPSCLSLFYLALGDAVCSLLRTQSHTLLHPFTTLTVLFSVFLRL